MAFGFLCDVQEDVRLQMAVKGAFCSLKPPMHADECELKVELLISNVREPCIPLRLSLKVGGQVSSQPLVVLVVSVFVLF